MAKHNETGNRGEAIAAAYLAAQGWEILERNWRFSRAEIDIIAKEGKVLVFVEVKTRSTDYFGKPEEFVSFRKEQLMTDAAGVYMEKTSHDWEIRFDIISVILKGEQHRLEHFRDAFFPLP